MNKVAKYTLIVCGTLLLAYLAPVFIKNITEQYRALLQQKTKVAHVKITDTICDIDKYQEQLTGYFADPEIKAILLEIESPGGLAGSSQALFNEIIHLKKIYKKPLVVLSCNTCASAAYYIACAADYIVTTPCALVGSIGSYIGQYKFHETLRLIKAQFEVQKSGDFKTAGHPCLCSTDEQRKMLQDVSDDTYQQFVTDVATQRKLSLKNTSQWANGRVFTGSQALKLHLIDATGSYHTAVQKIKELALIQREIEWVKPEPPSFWDRITEKGIPFCSLQELGMALIRSQASNKNQVQSWI